MGILSGNYSVDKAKKRIKELRQEIADIAERADVNAHSAMVEDFIDDVKEKGSKALTAINEQVVDVKEKAKENPKTSFAIAAGVGAIAALFFAKHNKS